MIIFTLALFLIFRFRTEFMKLNSNEFEGDYIFGNGVQRFLSSPYNHTIFDLIFDVIKGEWLTWKSYQIDESSEISGLISSNALSNREIVRLNPIAFNIINTK